MNSLEDRIYQYLKAQKKSKIHISEINKEIGTSEKEIKDTLLKIISEDPSMGHFEYSTGWLDRKIAVESINSIKKVLTAPTIGTGVFLLFFVPLYGFFISFALIGLGAFYLVKIYQYEELQRQRKASQVEQLGIALSTNRIHQNNF
ncbi:MAG: hypothetical protein ACFFC7_07695 [Candidatus Hermodarchaeota archaeon]